MYDPNVLNAKAARVLRKLARTGKIANANVEPFLLADYITISPPHAGHPFNHYELTDRGMAAIGKAR